MYQKILKNLMLCGSFVVGLCADDKSGFFLGVEGNLTQNKVTQSVYEIPKNAYWLTNQGSLGFDVGAKFGYQQYFLDFLGLRLGTYLGVGVPFQQEFNVANPDGVIVGLKSDFLPIRLGVDIDILFDFFEFDEHIVGVSVGGGYRYNHYFSLENTKNFRIAETNVTHLADFEISNLSGYEFYPQIGLHYYYEEEHQFEIIYRFGGAVYSKTKAVSNNRLVFPDGRELVDDPLFTQIQNTNYLTLSYTYLF